MSRVSEKGVIGCLLIEADSINEVATILRPDMFVDELYRIIYKEYLKAYENRYKIDEVKLRQILRDTNYPASIIEEELLSCAEDCISSTFIKSYADGIINEYKVDKADQILQRIDISPNNYKEKIGELINELQAVVDDKDFNLKSVSELAKQFKSLYFCDKKDIGVKTGFRQLDEVVGELEGGDVIVLGARPSVGKSAFVTQVSSNVIKQGKRVGFYNLEMKEKQLYERFVTNMSGIELKRLKRALGFQNDEKERFDKANEQLESKYSNLFINTGSKTMSEIRAECKHMEYDLIIIDYLQLLKPETNYRGNREAEVASISGAIKSLSMELNIPIIALSQLRRAYGNAEFKKPTMSELRESGSIEQDASVILLMWNLDEEDRSQKGMSIEKDRQGEVGEINLTFDGSHMKFIESGGTKSYSKSVESEKGDWEDADDTEDFPFNP